MNDQSKKPPDDAFRGSHTILNSYLNVIKSNYSMFYHILIKSNLLTLEIHSLIIVITLKVQIQRNGQNRMKSNKNNCKKDALSIYIKSGHDGKSVKYRIWSCIRKSCHSCYKLSLNIIHSNSIEAKPITLKTHHQPHPLNLSHQANKSKSSFFPLVVMPVHSMAHDCE